MEQGSHYRWLESARLVLTPGAILATGKWFAAVMLSPALQIAVVALCAASVAVTWILFTSTPSASRTVMTRQPSRHRFTSALGGSSQHPAAIVECAPLPRHSALPEALYLSGCGVIRK